MASGKELWSIVRKKFMATTTPIRRADELPPREQGFVGTTHWRREYGNVL